MLSTYYCTVLQWHYEVGCSPLACSANWEQGPGEPSRPYSSLLISLHKPSQPRQLRGQRCSLSALQATDMTKSNSCNVVLYEQDCSRQPYLAYLDGLGQATGSFEAPRSRNCFLKIGTCRCWLRRVSIRFALSFENRIPQCPHHRKGGKILGDNGPTRQAWDAGSSLICATLSESTVNGGNRAFLKICPGRTGPCSCLLLVLLSCPWSSRRAFRQACGLLGSQKQILRQVILRT